MISLRLSFFICKTESINTYRIVVKINRVSTSLVVQWIRICLPTQRTWVQSWSVKIRQAREKLNLCATTTERTFSSY